MPRPVYYRPKPTEDDQPSPLWRKLFDITMIEAILQDAACLRSSLSYAETLNRLGYDFSRPKMRALCAALNEVDTRARSGGEPPLAVLVVRANNRLPGAGWWIDKDRRRYTGPLEGAEAMAYIRRKQGDAFRFWSRRNLKIRTAC